MPLPRKKLIPGIFFLLMLVALAAPPLWWSEGNPPVIVPAAAQNNHGPANIGQAKHMAKSALDALRPVLPAVAAQIEADLAPITDLTVPEPKPADWSEKQKAPLLIGQLKAIADPFYTRLHAAAPAWLEAERTANGTNHPGSIFPWTTGTTDDANQAIANIGQLKAVFSLRFESLSTLDTDGDGLSDLVELRLGTSPTNPDSDNDEIPDGWEVDWGFNPLDPLDAGFDTDGDHVTNLREFQLGTIPTGLYRVETLPLGVNKYFHSAEDDGSVVLQATPEWDQMSALEQITAPDQQGNRAIVPFVTPAWNDLNSIHSSLVAEGVIAAADTLSGTNVASSDDAFRIFQTETGRFLLASPGVFDSTLNADVDWQAVNGTGDAVGIKVRLVPEGDGVDAHQAADLVISGWLGEEVVPMPQQWFPSQQMPSVTAFSKIGYFYPSNVLVQRPTNQEGGGEGHEFHSISVMFGEGDFVRIPTPGLGNESIESLSSENARFLGSGPRAFQIMPDGTSIFLDTMRIQSPPSGTPLQFGIVYPNSLQPKHISSDGRITLFTTDSSGGTMLIQIVPDNDLDDDGMADDWERDYAAQLLSYHPDATAWGTHYPDLASGNLDPEGDYTSEGVSARDLADMMADQQSGVAGNVGFRTQAAYRNNSMNAYQNLSDGEVGGSYKYSRTGDFPASEWISSEADLNPEYLLTGINAAGWSGPYWGGISDNSSAGPSSGFRIDPFPADVSDESNTHYQGFIRESRIRGFNPKVDDTDRKRQYLKVTRGNVVQYWPTDANMNLVYSDEGDVTGAEMVTIEIPLGKHFSDWYEVKSPMIAGQETTVGLLPVDITVVKEGEVAAPEDGLVVKKTDTVRYRLSPGLPDAPLLLEDKIQWHWRNLNWDGTYSAWTAFQDGQGHNFTAQPDSAGIYEIKAVVDGNDVLFQRKSDAHHADASSGHVQEIHKKGANDCLGVVDEQWQITLRDKAKLNLGSTRWAQGVELKLNGASDFAAGDDKCNAFVYEQGYNAGTPVPLTRGRLSNGPPMAIDWWNDNSGRLDSAGRAISSEAIPDWQRLPDYSDPQPGFVVARPDLTTNPTSYHSHVGIFDYDGSWISAGKLKVNKYYHPTSKVLDSVTGLPTTMPYQPQGFREFSISP